MGRSDSFLLLTENKARYKQICVAWNTLMEDTIAIQDIFCVSKIMKILSLAAVPQRCHNQVTLIYAQMFGFFFSGPAVKQNPSIMGGTAW